MSTSKAPNIRSSITARKMVSSAILNCPSQVSACLSQRPSLLSSDVPSHIPTSASLDSHCPGCTVSSPGFSGTVVPSSGLSHRRWIAVAQMTIMSIPITSLEFVYGVCLFDVAIHWKAPTFYHFLFVVVMMSDMVSALLGFPFQPFNHHPLITSGTGSHSSGVQNVPLASPVVCSKGRGRWHRIQ